MGLGGLQSCSCRGRQQEGGNVVMIFINPAVSLFPMSHHLFPFPLYFQAGRRDSVP